MDSRHWSMQRRASFAQKVAISLLLNSSTAAAHVLSIQALGLAISKNVFAKVSAAE